MKLSTEIPYKMWIINDEGTAIPVVESGYNGVPDPSNAPRQELPKTYYQDGYVDIFPFKTVTKFGNTAGKKILPFVINEFSHDIDTFHDLELINERLEHFSWPMWFKIPNQAL
jgi:CMP-N-acetylneuraminic acid synthetase